MSQTITTPPGPISDAPCSLPGQDAVPGKQDVICMWPATLALVASGGAIHRSLRCTAGVSRVEGGQPCKVAVTGWPCEPRGLPRKTQLGSVPPVGALPFDWQVLICHHSGASPVKLSIASHVPPGRGAATAVR